MRRGILLTFLAYLLWGVFPLYFRAINQVSAPEIIAHRIVWCILFMLILMGCLGRLGWFVSALRNPRLVGIFTCSAISVALNWGFYVYAIITDQTLEASFGYFINPLMAIAAGAIVFGERLRPAQWFAVALACVSVTWIGIQTGRAPWLGLIIAFSMTVYGAIRKAAPIGSLEGLTLETAILAPLALLYMGWLSSQESLYFSCADTSIQLLLLSAGPITAIPLLLFASGVRRIPYSMAGVIQYISPSMVFLLGVFCFDEPLSVPRLIGFILIWIAVFIFVSDSLISAKSRK